MERRALLRGLAAGLLLGPRLARASQGDPVCVDWAGPTPEMVTGPFPPRSFRETAAGRANPGAWVDPAENDFDLAAVKGATGAPKGQIVTLEVRVRTAGCKPVPGARVELWQADTQGFYNHKNERRVSPKQLDPAFGYWGSGKADADGVVRIRTIVPGKYPASRDWWRPPHLHWSVSADGLGQVTTQSYFDGDVLDGVSDIRALNRADYILNFREGFGGDLGQAALDAARKRSLDELVVRFDSAEDGVPHGSLDLAI